MAVLAVALTACGGPTAPTTDATGSPTSGPTGPTTGPTTSSTTGPPTGPTPLAPLPPGALDRTATAFRERVQRAGLPGGSMLVARDGVVVLDLSVGAGGRDVPMAVASTAKWLTAATLLTFVDEGALALDDPVARWLPDLASLPGLSVRHLLTHTSGLRDAPCIWQTDGSMAPCVAQVATLSASFTPGSAFSYGNGSFHVAGRVIEVLGGADFAAVVRARLTDPLGMAATTWPGAGANPSPAAGVRTTVGDYARFLAMLLADGVHDGRRILSSSSVRELVRNQIDGYDTTGDAAVAITRTPRYSLGAWPDRLAADGSTAIVSGNGAQGFYPWIDLETASYGVVGVQDDRGAEVAVPASQAVAAEAWAALRT